MSFPMKYACIVPVVSGRLMSLIMQGAVTERQRTEEDAPAKSKQNISYVCLTLGWLIHLFCEEFAPQKNSASISTRFLVCGTTRCLPPKQWLATPSHEYHHQDAHLHKHPIPRSGLRKSTLKRNNCAAPPSSHHPLHKKNCCLL